MQWLNYHHLLYFWVVVREGGLAAAGRALHLTHPTLSAQIRALERQLGEPLFERSGRRLVLSETGRVVHRYADEIFGLGGELLDTLAGRARGAPRLRVGVADVLPKAVVRRLLAPALALDPPARLVCREAGVEQLVGELAAHSLDLVLADAPPPPGTHVRAFHHPLGESGVALYGTPALVRRLRRGFPASLAGAPLLLPLEGQPLRRALDAWLAGLDVRPQVVAEIEDSALLKTFGADGVGLFPAPTVVERDLVARYGVRRLGVAAGVRQRYYAIAFERRFKNPAALAITGAGASSLSE